MAINTQITETGAAIQVPGSTFSSPDWASQVSLSHIKAFKGLKIDGTWAFNQLILQ